MREYPNNFIILLHKHGFFYLNVWANVSNLYGIIDIDSNYPYWLSIIHLKYEITTIRTKGHWLSQVFIDVSCFYCP